MTTKSLATSGKTTRWHNPTEHEVRFFPSGYRQYVVAPGGYIDVPSELDADISSPIGCPKSSPRKGHAPHLVKVEPCWFVQASLDAPSNEAYAVFRDEEAAGDYADQLAGQMGRFIVVKDGYAPSSAL